MINFLKYRSLYLTISLLVLVPGMYSLLRWGLKPSIDFVGGTVIEVKSETLIAKNFEEAFKNTAIEVESIHQVDAETITVRTKPIEREQWEEIKSATISGVLSSGLVETRFETVGPILGKELMQKTMIASTIAVFGILLYVAWAFKNMRFGVSAVVALVHDMLVVIGIFSLLGHFFGIEVDVLFVTALLTTMSFSVHDTIVVFDRIRESVRRDGLPFEETINKALTETMTRSLNNSMTIVFMLLALILLGGDTIRWFIVALLIGTISGTYSSPFVAVPVLYFLHKLREKRSRTLVVRQATGKS